MSWKNPDPANATERRRVRLVAALHENCLREIAERVFTARYPKQIEVSSGDPSETRWIYEDHGVGCVQITVEFRGQNLTPILQDEDVWKRWSDEVIGEIDGRRLRIQGEWPALRKALRRAMKGSERLDGFAELRSGSARSAADDTCDMYGNVLVLVHAHYDGDVVQEIAPVVKAAGSHNARAFGVSPGEPAGVLADNGLTALYFHDYGMVASHEMGNSKVAGAHRVLALSRYLWMGYTSIRVASEGLQSRIGEAVGTRGGLWTEHSLRDQVEQLMRLTGIVALMRYDAMPENFVADEFEARVYGGAFEFWRVNADVALLDQSITDATRVIEGLRNLASQKSERWLGTAIAFITGLTLASVLKDTIDFLHDPNRTPIDLGDIRTTRELSLRFSL